MRNKLLFFTLFLSVTSCNEKDKKIEDTAVEQFNIGCMYLIGKGVSQDGAKAAQWYTKAANKGHVRAQFLLGIMYETGKGVVKNRQIAKNWIGKACDTGDKIACAHLQNITNRVTPPVILENDAPVSETSIN